jgi:hypothetical protein
VQVSLFLIKRHQLLQDTLRVWRDIIIAPRGISSERGGQVTAVLDCIQVYVSYRGYPGLASIDRPVIARLYSKNSLIKRCMLIQYTVT